MSDVEQPCACIPDGARREFCLLVGSLLMAGPSLAAPAHPDRKWIEAAETMRRLAVSWGDQPYGAVLVTSGGLVAEGPSRVVRNADPTAHAEREAIRDAQRRLETADLAGAILYSTSRPCRSCEQVAAQARISRMYFGADMVDAGPPRP